LKKRNVLDSRNGAFSACESCYFDSICEQNGDRTLAEGEPYPGGTRAVSTAPFREAAGEGEGELRLLGGLVVLALPDRRVRLTKDEEKVVSKSKKAP